MQTDRTLMKTRLSNESFINIAMLIVLAVFFAAAAIAVPSFISVHGLLNIVSQQSYLIIIGIGVTLLLISGHFDLSVGGIAACAGVLAAFFSQKYVADASSPLGSGLGMSVLPAVILTLFICALIGGINAFFILRMKVASVIVTLGTMYMARGIALVVANGAQRNVGLPENFEILGDFTLGPLNLPVWIMIVLVIAALFVEKRTVFGRRLYYIGANKTTAAISGIAVNRQVAILYIINAVLAGFTGIILASKFNSGRAYSANGYEFNALVVTVLGGTSIAGGFGSVLNLLIGTFILGILSTSLNQLGLPPDIQTISKGVIIIAAVLAQRFVLERRKKRI